MLRLGTGIIYRCIGSRTSLVLQVGIQAPRSLLLDWYVSDLITALE
jgi:hypothetical protein